MLAYPKVDLTVGRLNRGGWVMGDLCLDREDGRAWIVTGQRGKHWIIAQAPSQAAAATLGILDVIGFSFHVHGFG